MRFLPIVVAGLIGSLLFASCKKDDSPAPYGKISLSFANEVSGQPLVLGPISYTNAAGNKYSVDMLKY
jgi:hypothetical protein